MQTRTDCGRWKSAVRPAPAGRYNGRQSAVSKSAIPNPKSQINSRLPPCRSGRILAAGFSADGNRPLQRQTSCRFQFPNPKSQFPNQFPLAVLRTGRWESAVGRLPPAATAARPSPLLNPQSQFPNPKSLTCLRRCALPFENVLPSADAADHPGQALGLVPGLVVVVVVVIVIVVLR